MADKAKEAVKDTASPAQGRITVSIPADLAALIKSRGAELAVSLKEAHGIAVELSPAQIVESVLRDALTQKPTEGAESE